MNGFNTRRILREIFSGATQTLKFWTAPAGRNGDRVQVTTDGARRANSFDYYRQIIGTDPDPVSVVVL
jgi:hypothetical protein